MPVWITPDVDAKNQPVVHLVTATIEDGEVIEYLVDLDLSALSATERQVLRGALSDPSAVKK